MTKWTGRGIAAVVGVIVALGLSDVGVRAAVNCDTTWTAGTGDWFTATNWDNGVPTSSKDACIGATDAKVITLTAGNTAQVDVLTISNPNAVLRVPSHPFADTALETVGGVANAGTVDLVSDTGTNASAVLRATTGGTVFTNTGVLRVPDVGGNRGARIEMPVVNNGTVTMQKPTQTGGTYGTSFVNNGTITVADGVAFNLNEPTAFTNNGAINTNATGEFINNGRTFEQGAGTITGAKPIRFSNGTLRFTDGQVGAGAFLVHEEVTLHGDIDANETVVVASGPFSPGTLKAHASYTNRGSINLVTSAGTSRPGILAAAADGITLTNVGSINVPDVGGSSDGRLELPIINNGTITMQKPTLTGGRNTSFVNNGTITVADGVAFNLNVPTAFTNNGAINTNKTGEFINNGRTFEQGAGMITGTKPVLFNAGTLRLPAGQVGSGSFLFLETNTVHGDLDPNETVTIDSARFSDGRLNADASLTNKGTIVLRTTPTDFTGQPGAVLAGTANGITLTNTGTIRGATTGGQGTNRLELPVINNGTIQPGQGSAGIVATKPLTLGPTSVWDERITSASSFDRLAVSSGSLALGGELHISEQPLSEPALNTTIRIADGGTITGTFPDVIQTVRDDDTGWTPVYSSNVVDLRFKKLVAPGAVAPTVDPISASNATAVPISGACPAAARVIARLNDSAGSIALGRGTCTDGGTFDLTANASGLVDGTIGVRITMTATNGTVSALPFTATTKDTLVGSVDAPTVSLTDPINLANHDSVRVSGACGEGNTLAIALASSGGAGELSSTATCSGAGDYDKVFDASSLNDGTVTASVTQTAAGLTSAAGTDTATKDTAAPGAPTVSITTDPIDETNETSVSLAGTCETGATVMVTMSDGASGTPSFDVSKACVDSAYAAVINVAGLEDGTVTATASQADAAGNASPTETDTVQKNTGGGADPVAGSIDITPAFINSSNVGSVSYTGACVAGNTVDITVADTSAKSVTVPQFTCAPGGTYSGTFNANSLTEGDTVTASAAQTDTVAQPADTDTAVKDTVGPQPGDGSIDVTPAFVNATNQAAVPFTGTCVAGNEVRSSAVDTHNNTAAVSPFMCESGGTFSQAFDARGLTEGDLLSVVALQFDPAGNNGASVFERIRKDTTAPASGDGSITAPAFINAANQAAVPLSGTCVEGNEVRAGFRDEHHHDLRDTFPCPAGGTFSRSFDARTISEGDRVSVTAVQADPAGNVGAAVATPSRKDTVAPDMPAPPTVSPSTVPSNGTESSVRFQGACTVGTFGSLTVNDTDATTAAVTKLFTCPTAGSYNQALDLRPMVPSKLTITLRFTDPAGNAGANRTSSVQKVVNRSINITPAFINATTKGAVPYSGKCSTGARVTITFTNPAKPTVIAVPTFTCPTSHTFSATFNASGLADGNISGRTTEATAAGAGLGFTIDTAVKDTTTPAGLTVGITPDPMTPAASQFARVKGNCETGATVMAKVNHPSNHNIPAKSGACTRGAYSIEFDLRTLPHGTIHAQAFQTDPAGNKSATVSKTARKVK